MKEYEIHYKFKTDKEALRIYMIKEAMEIARAKKEFDWFCAKHDGELVVANLIEKTTTVTQKTLAARQF